MKAVKINQLEIENVKRIKAVLLTPTANGLTIIGGNNNQGKTSVLDAIAWALGGDRYRPSQAQRDGAPDDPHLKVTLSNGIVAERRGKNGALKVTDPSGRKAGQQLLNSFLSELALDLPKFLEASDKDKAETLLQIIGVRDQLIQLDAQEQKLYHERWAVGQQADRKKKHAQEMRFHPDAPDTYISAGDLIRRQQAILAQNADNQRKRQQRDQLKQQAQDMECQIAVLKEQLDQVRIDLAIAETDAADLQDQSTDQLEKDLDRVEQINLKVRDNQAKALAEKEAEELAKQYNQLSQQVDDVRSQRQQLLENADLPLPGLSVEQGKLYYQGKAWDCMSGSDQLRVAVSIVRRLNPQCGFVLLDKLEQMDSAVLEDFGQWLESEGLQAIATRVSIGDECSVIIEDGFVAPQTSRPKIAWTPGQF